ncbi:hypothetical protein L3067_04370 [Xanthomonas sp. PPL568]|uniref:hypothetical protein n=1 Tax=Xanthomonas indica TaxID=2912242 RepID=UPI001F55E1EA|nr:hypothetical protein [Xanthomonas indica]MCI2243843.1 hypothetical protein [Xanthomonas indica]
MNTTLTPEALQRAMAAACQAGEYTELPNRVYDALIAGWEELQASQAQVPEAEDLHAAVATLRAALCNSEPEWRALCTLMAAVPGGEAALLAAAPAPEVR